MAPRESSSPTGFRVTEKGTPIGITQAGRLGSEKEIREDPLIHRLLSSIGEEAVRDYLVHDFLRSRGLPFDAARTGPRGFLATRACFRRASCIGSDKRLQDQI